MKRLRDLMTPASRLRFLAWRACGIPAQIAVDLRSGERLLLRREPATEAGASQDLGIAHEVFAHEVYHSPRPLNAQAVQLIVDVGGNVGYSVLYFATRFPASRVEVLEPHPDSFKMLERHLEVNRLAHRVTAVRAAAGTGDGRGCLTDAAVKSRLVSDCHGDKTIGIAVVDLFKRLAGRRIDVLKMDIEGGEYDLIMDPRFSSLDFGALVLEWHADQAHPTADADIANRLREMRCEVVSVAFGENQPAWRTGLIWGFRDRQNARGLNARGERDPS